MEYVAIADGQEVDFEKPPIDIGAVTLIRGRQYKKEEQKILLLSSDLQALLAENKCWIAGGAVTSVFTNKSVNDLDIYFPNKESFSNVMAEVYGGAYGLSFKDARICHMTDKSILLQSDDQDIQFIAFKFFESVDEIFDSFDFTINMGAYSFADRCFYLHDNFLRHNSERMLKFNSRTDYPLISMIRVDKYRERGYTTSKQEMLKIGFAVNAKNFDSWDKVIDEVGSMYGLNKDEIFDTTKPFSIDEVIEQLDGLFLPKNYKSLDYGYDLFELAKRMPSKLSESVLEYIRLESLRTYAWQRLKYTEYLDKVANGTYTPPEAAKEAATPEIDFF